MVKLRDVARPLKSRRDATKTEAAADGAARQFERCRKDLAAKKALVKKSSVELKKLCRSILKEAKPIEVLSAKRRKLFDAAMKKMIRDALSLKKDNDYALPVGKICMSIPNVDAELFNEVLMEIKESAIEAIEDSDAGEEEMEQEQEDDEREEADTSTEDKGRACLVQVADYLAANKVDQWQKAPEPGEITHQLDRSAVVALWKKSNTRGGCFQQKKMNYVGSATLAYQKEKRLLAIHLDVLEGEPED